MSNHPPDGGGNAYSDNSIIVRRSAAVGDALCATVVAKKLIERGYQVTFQSHPGCHCVLRRFEYPMVITEPGGFTHIDLDNSYEKDPNRRSKHFHRMFLEAANQQLAARSLDLGPPINCKPKMMLSIAEKVAGLNFFKDYPRPWVMICPRSNTYNVRQVPDGIWHEAAARMAGTKFWLGTHPAPPGIIDLGVRHLDNLIIYLGAADILVSVDTGPLHIAAALGIPIVAMDQSSSPQLHLSDQCDYVSINPRGNLTCLNCQQNVCPISTHMPPCQQMDPVLIADWVNARLRSQYADDVSAVVAIYRPDRDVLNRCLESIVNQVEEVVVVRDSYGKIPEGAMTHRKIKYLTCPQSDIGYGRKVNFGTRYTNGKWILHVNDDAYLDPDCVAKMKLVVREDTGIVAPILRYPSDRTIYHAGKVRSPGARGWGHIDHRKHLPTFTEPTELENTCGCVIMVRRKAFYEIDGFDERFYVYAEDDDLSLSIRKAGYRIMLQPAALGWHEEHHSTKKTEGIVDIMHRSNAIFGQKWGKYFDHNATRIPGNFNYIT